MGVDDYEVMRRESRTGAIVVLCAVLGALIQGFTAGSRPRASRRSCRSGGYPMSLDAFLVSQC